MLQIHTEIRKILSKYYEKIYATKNINVEYVLTYQDILLPLNLDLNIMAGVTIWVLQEKVMEWSKDTRDLLELIPMEVR